MTNKELISLRDVRFRWNRCSDFVVDVPALQIGAGKHFLVQGASGSGKSSLLGLLAGVNVAVEGDVTLHGQSLGGMSPAQRDRFRADHIGYIFQVFNLVPYLSVIDNVLLPLRFSDRRCTRAGRTLHDRESEAMRLLQDVELAAVARRRVTELSVGQQQRVAAARALIGGTTDRCIMRGARMWRVGLQRPLSALSRGRPHLECSAW